MTSRQQKGQAGEEAAAAHLQRRGLKIIERNFRVRGGEIDLICREGATTVFVEVRRRSRGDFGGAAASITAAKQARLILAARYWLARSGRDDIPCRFDCVLIDGERLDWLRDAFSA
jgi:putative endonuclease